MELREQRLARWHVLRAKRKDLDERLSEIFRSAAWKAVARNEYFSTELQQKAYEAGFLPKTAFVHGKYYFGKCRNAEVARWDAHRQVFTYIREKFGCRFPEDIRALEDDDKFDLFYAVCEIEPEPDEVIPETWNGGRGAD